LFISWSFEKNRSVSRNRMRMRNAFVNCVIWSAISGTKCQLYDCRFVVDQNKNHMARHCAD
jgi:hypothetical protein